MGKWVEPPNHSGASFILWPCPPLLLPSALDIKAHLSTCGHWSLNALRVCVCVHTSVSMTRPMCMCGAHVHMHVVKRDERKKDGKDGAGSFCATLSRDAHNCSTPHPSYYKAPLLFPSLNCTFLMSLGVLAGTWGYECSRNSIPYIKGNGFSD